MFELRRKFVELGNAAPIAERADKTSSAETMVAVRKTKDNQSLLLHTQEGMKPLYGIFAFSSVKYIHAHTDTDVYEDV